MTIEYAAIFGNGYYYNLRHISKNVYRADILHNTKFGWMIEEDVMSHLLPEHFKKGKMNINKEDFATEEEIAIGLLGDMIDRFPDALTK